MLCFGVERKTKGNRKKKKKNEKKRAFNSNVSIDLMDSEGTRPKCPRGLLTTDYYDNIETFISAAYETGHDFLATPIVYPKYGDRVNKYTGKKLQEWRAHPVYDRDDLILKKARTFSIFYQQHSVF